MLKSTWEREAAEDWLWPHENDEGQWLTNYGAGLAVRDSSEVVISGLVARRGQNGIVLERVVDSTVELCDASFLSGWGLAMWRSSRNRVEGNRFDYCIRGYAHGRYNRGQDSAGILLFEQSCDNLFALSSVTHGGDGVFGFAGNGALGIEGRAGVGCNGNTFRDNDLSFAAAHGLELTFSFGNRIEDNWIEGNAICGIWAGYSRDTRIAHNRLIANGDAGYGRERGAINAEHGQRIEILGNEIKDNALGVRFWTDADLHLAEEPWTRVNGMGARDNVLAENGFFEPKSWLHLREAGATAVEGVRLWKRGPMLDADASSLEGLEELKPRPKSELQPHLNSWLAWDQRLHLQEEIERRVQGLDHSAEVEVPWQVLRDRSAIVLGAWGPLDFESAYLQRLERGTGTHSWRLLGASGFDSVKRLHGDVTLERAPSMPGALAAEHLSVQPQRGTTSSSYAIEVMIGGERQVLEGWLCAFDWSVVAFSYTFDPREDEAEWRAEALGEEVVTARLRDLKLAFSDGPGRRLGFSDDLSGDHFGVLASSEVELPAGQFLLRTLSDDGVRVKVDGRVEIERWDHHGATEDGALLKLEEAGPVRIEVEYFELDGAAVLEFELRPL